jgi:hypothetical protein
MKRGDPVVYLPDPLLYGEMEVWVVRQQGRRRLVVCKIDPDSVRPSFELFAPRELDVPKPVPKAAPKAAAA